jgi:hypothetical protein
MTQRLLTTARFLLLIVDSGALQRSKSPISVVNPSGMIGRPIAGVSPSGIISGAINDTPSAASTSANVSKKSTAYRGEGSGTIIFGTKSLNQ